MRVLMTTCRNRFAWKNCRARPLAGASRLGPRCITAGYWSAQHRSQQDDRIRVNGVPANLTGLEYRVLAYLSLNQERSVTPHELQDHLYGDGNAREANALEAVIARLCRKLGANAIITRRGFGYSIGGDRP